MAERFCGRDARCRAAAAQAVARGRTVQGVIVAMGESLYQDSVENAERAYEVMSRSLVFAHDFLSDAELAAGQSAYPGTDTAALREILARCSWVCEVNRFNWLSRYRCLRHRVAAFEPRS
jgi:hypothetical protein